MALEGMFYLYLSLRLHTFLEQRGRQLHLKVVPTN